MIRTLTGEHCQACNATEADCARMGRCCSLCSHFTHLDANGNDLPPRPPGRRPQNPKRYTTAAETLGPQRAARLARVLELHQRATG